MEKSVTCKRKSRISMSYIREGSFTVLLRIGTGYVRNIYLFMAFFNDPVK
jgi:hypothetical protein